MEKRTLIIYIVSGLLILFSLWTLFFRRDYFLLRLLSSTFLILAGLYLIYLEKISFPRKNEKRKKK